MTPSVSEPIEDWQYAEYKLLKLSQPKQIFHEEALRDFSRNFLGGWHGLELFTCSGIENSQDSLLH